MHCLVCGKEIKMNLLNLQVIFKNQAICQFCQTRYTIVNGKFSKNVLTIYLLFTLLVVALLIRFHLTILTVALGIVLPVINKIILVKKGDIVRREENG